jgi:hexosaminidase
MLDTSRHFLSVPAIEQAMDAMAMVKLNALHLHLTDDNSWPVAIAKWPRLASASAYSNFSHTYSAADLAGLVAYGRQRGIRLIPEFDTPAHSSSLFAAYPQFAAAAVDPTSKDPFLCLVDPSREEVFAFQEALRHHGNSPGATQAMAQADLPLLQSGAIKLALLRMEQGPASTANLLRRP